MVDTEEDSAPGKNLPYAQADVPVTLKIRNRPPFPGLPSYNVSALVLAFTGHADEVEDLLERLAHSTAAYFRTHRPILKGALVSWDAKIAEIVEFEDAYQQSSLSQAVAYKIQATERPANPNAKRTSIRMHTRAQSVYESLQRDPPLPGRQRAGRSILRKQTVSKIQKRNPFDFVPSHFYCNSVFPSQKKLLEEWSRKKAMRLKAVRLKCCSNRSALTGIQFVYANGLESPLFQTEGAAKENEIHTVNIDPNRTIRKVSLKVDGQKIGGMRLLDERNDYVMNATWNSERRGKWLTRTLSPGLEIIGL